MNRRVGGGGRGVGCDPARTGRWFFIACDRSEPPILWAQETLHVKLRYQRPVPR
jgi:hypothetical protein